MRIGVDYYPEQWDRALWVKDADLMKQTGVKIVRLAEFAWCRMEPLDGQFDFTWLDEVIDIFVNRGIDIVLCTPTNCPPLWLYEKYPDAIQTGKDGHKIPIGIRGHRCYNSPSFLKFAKRIIDRMTSHYRGNKAIIAWQIDNELESNFCFCENCITEYRTWLKDKYTSLEALNKAYGNVVWSGEYSSWEQIQPPFGNLPQAWKNPSFMLDFNRYASDNMIKYVKMQSEIIRKNGPDIPITTNTWFCENMPDFYKVFEELDFVSYDNYPTTKIPEDKEEYYSHAFHLDIMRGIKQDNFWIMEELSGGLGCWMPMSYTPRPNMIKGYSLQALAHGADTILHFRWRTAATGAEMHWHGILDQSNVPGRRYFEFKDLCKTAEKLEELKGAKLKAEVAILYSAEQEYAFKIQPQTEGMYYSLQPKAFHDAFTKFGVNVDIINWSSDLTSYKVVVAPTIYVTNPIVTNNIYEYVKNGGTLILTNRSGVKDENNNYPMEMLPTVFSELIGARITEYDPIGNTTQSIQMVNRKEFDCTQWCDIIEPITAEVIAVYGESFYQNKSAVIRNDYGKGQTYYVGTVGKKAFYYEFIESILMQETIEYFKELPYGVEITTCEKEKDTYYYVFNNSDEACEFNFTREVTNYLTKEPAQIIKLQPYDMVILKIIQKEQGGPSN